MFYNCKKLPALFGFVLILIVITASSFRLPAVDFSWIEQCLRRCFNATSTEAKLKKWELSVTDKGFLRLKKYLPSGKQEYFSFNLNKLEDLSYSGTEESGEIILKTLSDDIIVQTYNDPKGNIDSMSDLLKIPVTHISSETLDSLRINLKGKNE